MSDGIPGRPRVLRGAFVEFGLSLPPLFVVFQYNPLQLTRNRTLTFSAPGTSGTGATTTPAPAAPARSLRQFHAGVSDLTELRKQQQVTVEEQTIGFDIRLDATDRLDERDTIAEQFGIAPQLSTLELMVQPKSESLLGSALGALLGKPQGFSFTRGENPPMVLFVFGRKRVLPVNINALNITETEFSADLDPIRATVAVNLTVIEGKSLPYRYSKAMTEAMSVLNLANVAELADVVVPG
jgi:hypothetical protein